MPVPANTPGLTLGRALFDKRKFRADTDPAVIDCLAMLSMERAGAGWSGPAKGADEVYMAVYAQSDGGGAHNLYGGNPADPVNPYPLTVSASGSATVNWEEEGVLVLSSGTANFVGSGVTVTDVAGTATITITGGGSGTVTEAFKTIAIDVATDATGQADVVADSATDTLTLKEVFGIEITTNAGADTIGFAFRNGDGLESDGGNPGVAPAKVRVKAHTYIDVTSNGVAVDFTEVASYNGAGDQYLRNNAGTFQWATLPAQDGVGYDEIQENGTPVTKRAKVNFINATVSDDAGNSRTNVTVGGGQFYLTLEDIPAATWDGTTLTLGSGDAELFESTGTGTYETDGLSHTIYNSVEDEIPSGKVVQCKIVDGLPVVDVEDCG